MASKNHPVNPLEGDWHSQPTGLDPAAFALPTLAASLPSFLPFFWPAWPEQATVLSENNLTRKAGFLEPLPWGLSRWHFALLLVGTWGWPLHQEAGRWMIATCPETEWGTIGGIEDYYFCHHCLLKATLIVTALPPLCGVMAQCGCPMPDSDGKSAEVHLGGLGCVVCTARPTFYFILFFSTGKNPTF